ncbi:hypothetical protein E2542_SST19842 [Spatholobus suberectus]|nr:hypothetical protein E2542_SST19842 [Spatholobus suberectus]
MVFVVSISGWSLSLVRGSHAIFQLKGWQYKEHSEVFVGVVKQAEGNIKGGVSLTNVGSNRWNFECLRLEETQRDTRLSIQPAGTTTWAGLEHSTQLLHPRHILQLLQYFYTIMRWLGANVTIRALTLADLYVSRRDCGVVVL